MEDTLKMPEIEFFSVATLENLAEVMPRRTPWFTLLLAGDSPNTDPVQFAAQLRPLVDSGLVYFSAWGQGCEELHDALDEILTERDSAGNPPPYEVMASSHVDESLGDAVWFFNTQAIPADAEVFANFARYAVAVGGEESARRLKQTLLRMGISGSEIKP